LEAFGWGDEVLAVMVFLEFLDLDDWRGGVTPI
jgi:hypothetical protein